MVQPPKNVDYLEGYIVELTPNDTALVSPSGIARIVFDGAQLVASVNGGPFQALSGGGALGPALSALNALIPAADQAPYYTGPATAALTGLTAAGRDLLDDASAADQRTTLGLGTAAVVDAGTAAGDVPVLDGAAELSLATGVEVAGAPGVYVRLDNAGELSASNAADTITIDAVSISTDAPTLTLDAADTINLTFGNDLQINSSAGLAGEVLTSSGPGVPPVWSAPGGGGPWTLVATKTFTASATETFSGLDGDTDEIYWLEGELTLSAGSQVAIYPNGNTGAVCSGCYFALNSGGAPPSSAATTQILLPASSTLGGTARVAFWTRVDAQSRGATLPQLFQTQAITRYQGPISFQTLQEQIANSFNPSPIVNLTSIEVAAVAGTATGKVSLYKLSRT